MNTVQIWYQNSTKFYTINICHKIYRMLVFENLMKNQINSDSERARKVGLLLVTSRAEKASFKNLKNVDKNDQFWSG